MNKLCLHDGFTRILTHNVERYEATRRSMQIHVSTIIHIVTLSQSKTEFSGGGRDVYYFTQHITTYISNGIMHHDKRQLTNFHLNLFCIVVLET